MPIVPRVFVSLSANGRFRRLQPRFGSRAKLRGEVSQHDYEQANVEFTREMSNIERQLSEPSTTRRSADAFVRFCELAIADIPAVMEQAHADQRRRVRQLLFSDGILLNSERELSNPGNLRCSVSWNLLL
jgi:hypothetical protein